MGPFRVYEALNSQPTCMPAVDSKIFSSAVYVANTEGRKIIKY